MSQFTIRDVPDAVERAIRRRAAEEHKSINRTVNELLQKALGIEPLSQKRRDFSALSGSWEAEEAAEFERSIAPFEQIDDEVWH